MRFHRESPHISKYFELKKFETSKKALTFSLAQYLDGVGLGSSHRRGNDDSELLLGHSKVTPIKLESPVG